MECCWISYITSKPFIAEAISPSPAGSDKGFNITSGIFTTVTRYKATNNTIMLKEFEIAAARDVEYTKELRWMFTVKKGDMRCMAHIIWNMEEGRERTSGS